MRHLRAFLARMRAVVRRSPVASEIDEEIQSHLDTAAADYARGGTDPLEARRMALRSFARVASARERYLDLVRFQRIEAVFQDVHYALRTLRKRPGFTAVAVAMLALGLGVNTAVFTVIHAALFEGWPQVRRNDRIVQITTSRHFVYYPDFEAWRSQSRSFQGMALLRGRFHTLAGGADASSGAAPETCFTTEVTANMFPLLGVKPFLGRDFLPSDEKPGAARAVILRYELWSRRFGSNPAIVGKAVLMDGLPVTVIGVMPKGFSFPFPMRQDLWTPLTPTPAALRRETGYAPYAFARLADGVAIGKARAELEGIGRRLATAFPATNRDVVPVVSGFEDWFIGRDSRTLYKGMWGAVAFLLLIAGANVANLLVQQAIGRSHEISIRLALGAGRWRIIRQFLVESLTLSILGGVIGWWIAKAGVRIYALAQVHDDVLNFTMNPRVFAWLVAISLGTGILAGLAAATHLAQRNIDSTSKDGGRGVAGGKQGKRLSGLFVTAEMVLAVVLLASAGVILRSFLNVYTANLGVNKANILAISAPDLPPERYPGPASWMRFYGDLETRLEALPGVASVAFGLAPADNTPRFAYQLAGSAAVNEQSRVSVAEIIASTGYFKTLGTGIVSGRSFNRSDRASGMPVVIVNRRFASRNWAGESPLGKQLRLLPAIPGKKNTPWLTVVGVVANIVENDRTRQAFDPVVYLPFAQAPAPFMPVLVRTGVTSESLVPAIRRQIYALDPELPVPVLLPLSERLDRGWAFERNIAVLFLFFAVVALLLAVVGLYASVSWSVSRRLREIGLRVAVGATSGDVFRLVFRQGILPVGTGLSLGFAIAFAINRILKSQLVGVSPADPLTLVAASAALVLAAAFGCWLPARRAVRVDPAAALRHE